MQDIGERPSVHGNIMVVDDNPANLKLLEEMLRQRQYAVSSFPRGRLALAAAHQKPPDLILLDINMPEMNGYEVCERLKSSVGLSGIPVIFLSALNAADDKVRAFTSGGVDYISKPFELQEVLARVETHLSLHNLQRALKQHNEVLEETVAVRTRELIEANAQLKVLDRSKNEFLNLISHEFRTPLHGLLGVGELILEEMTSSAEHGELQEIFERSRNRILAILDDAALLTQIDVNGTKLRAVPVSLSAVLTHAIQQSSELAESCRVTLDHPLLDSHLVLGDEGLLIRALHALLVTAVKFSKEGQTVRLATEHVPDSLRVVIESDGKTIPGPVIAKFFDLFSVSESSTPAGDLGLGPPVACRILALFGASVSVTNRDQLGIRLTVSFKSALQTSKSALQASKSALR